MNSLKDSYIFDNFQSLKYNNNDNSALVWNFNLTYKKITVIPLIKIQLKLIHKIIEGLLSESIKYR